MRKKIIVFFLLLPAIIYSQEKFLSIDNSLKKGSRSVKDSFVVLNEENNTLAFFIDDNKTLNGYLYSENLELKAKYASEGLPNKFDEIIGETKNGNSIQLFLKDKKNKRFGSVTFNFDTSTSIEKEFDFKLKKDRYLQSFSFKDKFYLVTVKKRSSILNIYIFDHQGNYELKEINLSNEKFINSTKENVDLYTLITEVDVISNFVDISKIDNSTPNSVDVTKNFSKFYSNKDHFIISLDESDLVTYIIKVSIPELSVDFSYVQKEQLLNDTGTGFVETNSYLTNDKIFQIISSSKEMIFTVKDLNTKKELKKISLNKDQKISFKNTPIIQEGGVYNPDRVREMEKTSKFLRKISSGNVGLAVIKRDDGYQVTMGGSKELSTGGGAMPMMGGFGGLPIATAGAFTISYNPVFFAYNSYAGTKSTRIECLFDNDFNHIEGEIPRNVFDEIKDFTEKIKQKKAENVFRFKDLYIYGYYNSKIEKYILYKFPK